MHQMESRIANIQVGQKEVQKNTQLLGFGMRQMIERDYGTREGEEEVKREKMEEEEKEVEMKKKENMEKAKNEPAVPVVQPRKKNLAQSSLMILHEEDEEYSNDPSTRDIRSGKKLKGYREEDDDDLGTSAPEPVDRNVSVRNKTPIQKTSSAVGNTSDLLDEQGNISLVSGRKSVGQERDSALFKEEESDDENTTFFTDESDENEKEEESWEDHEKNLQITRTEHCPTLLMKGRRKGSICGRKTFGKTGYCKNHQSDCGPVRRNVDMEKVDGHVVTEGAVYQDAEGIHTPPHNLNMGVSVRSFRVSGLLDQPVMNREQMGSNIAFYEKELDDLDRDAEEIIGNL